MLRTFLMIASALPLVGCLNVTVVSTDGEKTPVEPSESSAPSVLPDHQTNSHWYVDEQRAVRERNADASAGRAKNIVFFLGDGMGVSTVTAARILAGQRLGGSGEEYSLSFDHFPMSGLAKTYNVDSQTPDSAGTMSAIVTGVKTNISMFGVDETASPEDCMSATDHGLLSLLEIAELAGRSTGVISTARLTHATPAATYAKTVNRDWEDDTAMPEDAAAAGCSDIATQFVTHRQGMEERFGAGASDGIEVALGGGLQHFLPTEDGGSRSDSVNLIERWETLNPGGRFVEDSRGLQRVKSAPVLGLFADSHMQYQLERAAPDARQPSLVAMTRKAVELLAQDSDGFFLVVEAGRINHGHHAGNAANALNETIELSDAVAAVMEMVDPKETLVIVTADHSHVFTMAGYPRRGNPILGKVIPAWSDEPMLDANGMPYTTLGYMNGRGFRDYGDEPNADTTYAEPPDTGRKDISDVDTTAPGYHQEALIPSNAETHAGEDVPVYLSGPGSHTGSGSYEQNRIFHIMLQATDWERAAAERAAQLR